MAHILKALVGESSTTTGTGAFTLDAALTDHRRFSAVCATNDTVEYMIRHATDGSWEAGVGTYSSANTLTRTTMVESSTGSAVSFAAGDKEVVLTHMGTEIDTGYLDLKEARDLAASFITAAAELVRGQMEKSYEWYDFVEENS